VYFLVDELSEFLFFRLPQELEEHRRVWLYCCKSSLRQHARNISGDDMRCECTLDLPRKISFWFVGLIRNSLLALVGVFSFFFEQPNNRQYFVVVCGSSAPNATVEDTGVRITRYETSKPSVVKREPATQFEIASSQLLKLYDCLKWILTKGSPY
jgi:hypothetical protein